MSKESIPPILCEEPGKDSRGKNRPRLLAWVQHHDSHGLMYDNIVWMPEGDKPEIGEWIRAFWMDEPVSWWRTGKDPDGVTVVHDEPPEGWYEARRAMRDKWEKQLRENNTTVSTTDAYTDGFYDGARWGKGKPK